MDCHVDYNKICSILRSELEYSDSNFTLLSVNTRGGLGHKQVSLFLSVTYALLLRRPLRSKSLLHNSLLVLMKPVVWNNTNSCLSALKFQGREPILY